MVRTDDEIIERIKFVKESGRDWLWFETSDLVVCLPFEKAEPFLKPGAVDEGSWTQQDRSRDAVLSVMQKYMPFAWEKANGFRGISAGRSMSHYMAWTWLAGDDLGDLTEYEFYGKDNLRRICDHYGWNADQWDDGVRKNAKDE